MAFRKVSSNRTSSGKLRISGSAQNLGYARTSRKVIDRNFISSGSLSTSSPAFLIETINVENTINLVNNGRIQGAGGAGGDFYSGYGENGYAGGTALYCNVPLKIDNTNGRIFGGGGGGGWRSIGIPLAGIPGSGGAGWSKVGPAGLKNTAITYWSPGLPGTSESGGAAVYGSFTQSSFGVSGLSGGGGNPGNSGGTSSSGQAGGRAGFYIEGNQYVTWSSIGDRRGPIS